MKSASKKVGRRKRIVKRDEEGGDGEGLKSQECAVNELIKVMD